MRKPLLNCDLGEGMPYDKELMSFIDSCSIASGGHYGDPETISRTIELALENDVLIGAHPSFPDRENFGRKNIEIDRKDLFENLRGQLVTFYDCAKSLGAEVDHIKPHGALYNLIVKDEYYGQLFIDLYRELELGASFYTPSHSFFNELVRQSEQTIIVVHEAFADRSYDQKANLISRNDTSAMIVDPQQSWEQLRSIFEDEVLTIAEGKEVALNAETFCVHGDTSEALILVKYLNAQIKKNYSI